MKKSGKILLGLASFWPAFYFALFIVFFIVVFIAVFANSPFVKMIFPLFFVVFFLHLMTILLIFGLLIYYIVHLFKNDRIPDDLKALWAVVLFFGNIISFPVYWFLYIWREPNSQTAEFDKKA